MDDRYFHGILGCEAVVCGRRLSNLTPWHVTILYAINSPFVGDDVKMTAGDVLLFLAVSKAQWPERPNLKPRLRDIWWLIRMGREREFRKQSRILNAWVKPQLSTPRLWQDEGNKSTGKNLTSPAMAALVVTLVSKVGVTLKEAWNMRLSEARWYDTVKAELEGAEIKVAYDNEEEFKDGLEGKRESEIIAIARQQLEEKAFKQWLAARRKNKNKSWH